MISPETLEMLQKGGSYLLLVIAIGWLIRDRNRLLAIVAEKDDKLLSLSERTIVVMTELKGLLSGRGGAK